MNHVYLLGLAFMRLINPDRNFSTAPGTIGGIAPRKRVFLLIIQLSKIKNRAKNIMYPVFGLIVYCL